CARGSEDFDSW
nr:immunoglobulin heavy chain junction region [Macaca mulatta]MOY21970.1 immunoglobulin heavy chain junction region [Macaca mulatta]MOY22043.1 immunoglobulin heavy chain junction region [Macaca mulatta]MOY22189.1 immunoglobulin heavy chain junction region [Macaca mulatta]MOY24332.1 immunoglobulin heavy chain junction region [Macaca mulatta]